MPVAGENLDTLINPESMTHAIPGIVREVSAIEVESITLRLPKFSKTLSCSSLGRDP
jgi:hypothetical protein